MTTIKPTFIYVYDFLNNCNRNHMAPKLEIFTIWPFIEVVCQALIG